MTTSGGPATRILIVDDHALVRAGIREILEGEPDLEVVGEAGDSSQAVVAARRTMPDVVILDIQIPGAGARATLTEIRRVAPQARVIALSMHDDPRLVRELLGMGLRGYLLKSVSREDLISAVRGVHRDDERVVILISRSSMVQVSQDASGLLSAREQEIMELVARAMSNAQIAHRLSVAEGTIKRHLRNIFRKLGAVSRIDAVNKAIEASLISSGSADARD